MENKDNRQISTQGYHHNSHKVMHCDRKLAAPFRAWKQILTSLDMILAIAQKAFATYEARRVFHFIPFPKWFVRARQIYRRKIAMAALKRFSRIKWRVKAMDMLPSRHIKPNKAPTAPILFKSDALCDEWVFINQCQPNKF